MVCRPGRIGLPAWRAAAPPTDRAGNDGVSEDEGRLLAVKLAEWYAGEGAGQEYLDLPPEVMRVTIRITPDRVLGSAA